MTSTLKVPGVDLGAIEAIEDPLERQHAARAAADRVRAAVAPVLAELGRVGRRAAREGADATDLAAARAAWRATRDRVQAGAAVAVMVRGLPGPAPENVVELRPADFVPGGLYPPPGGEAA